MEVLVDEPVDLELVADLCAVGIKRGTPVLRDRSKWHVSNLLESAWLISRGDNRYHEYVGHPSGIMSLGRIWETAADCYLSDWAARCGGGYISDVERERDEIVGSLDGVVWTPDLGWMVCETKLRFSLSKDIPMRHLQQVRAYCHLAWTDLVCYMSGHLSSTPPTAQASLRVIRLTQQSIDETWEMLLSTKRYLERCRCDPNVESGTEVS